MTKRKHIGIKTKLAAALCQMLRDDGTGKLVPVIDRDSAKNMSEDQILSLWAWDHDPIPHAWDGSSEHWNLVPRPILEHRVKTAKRDVPAIAKTRRIAASQQEFRRRILVKDGHDKPDNKPDMRRKASWPKGRKMQSRPFTRRDTKND